MSTTVREVMTTEVVSISSSAPFKEVARLMVSREVSALPVVDEGRVVGIVTETDLAHKEEFQPSESGDEYHEPIRARLRHPLSGAQSKARAETAEGLMNRKVVTARPDDSVVASARTMERYDIKQLPVVDERGHLLGLLSRRDLLRVFARPDEDIARDIGAQLVTTPAWLDVDRVRITVDDGVVTLDGRLDHHSHCAMTTKLVHGVDGVVAVHNKLTWDIEDMLPPTLSEPS